MNIEEEEFEMRMAQIVDQMGYLMMDIILMSFKKINTENQLLKELLEARLQAYSEEEFQSFGKTESGYPGEET